MRHKLAGADADQKLFSLAESAGSLQPLGVGRELPDRFGISSKPGETVGRALLTVEHTRYHMAINCHARRNGTARVGEPGLGGGSGLIQSGIQFIAGGLRRYGKRHGKLRRNLAARTAFRLYACTAQKQLFASSTPG